MQVVDLYNPKSLAWVVSWLTALSPVEVFGQGRPTGQNEQTQQAQAVEPQPTWTHQSADNLWFQCSNRSSEKQQSCFDVPIGAKLYDLIPVRGVGEPEKASFSDYWNKVLQPGYKPIDASSVEFRTMALGEVSWRPARPNSKDAHPPNADIVFARWTSSGLTLIASGWELAMQLPEEHRIDFRYPSVDAVSHQSGWSLVSKFDKSPLLSVLKRVFGIPWQSADDFDIYWNASPFSEGHLKIKSKRYVQSGHVPGEGPEPAWMNWSDEIAFKLRGTNPQILRISTGHWKTPTFNPSQPLSYPSFGNLPRN